MMQTGHRANVHPGRWFVAGCLAFVPAIPAVFGDPPDIGKPPVGPAEKEASPFTFLAVATSGSVRVRLGPGAALRLAPDAKSASGARSGQADGSTYLKFTLLRLRPGVGRGSEEAMLAGSEMVGVAGGPADVEVFCEEAAGAEVPGPCRIEIHRIQQGAPEETAVASAGLWRGSVADWLRALEEERRTALDLLAGGTGNEPADESGVLSRIEELRFFTALDALRDVFQARNDEVTLAQIRTDPDTIKGGAPPWWAKHVVGGAPAGAPAPAAAAGKDAKTGAEPAVVKPEGPTIAKIRRQVSREALAHLVLAAEHLAIRAALPEQDNGGFAADWRLLAEACGRLIAEDPALREADPAVRDAGLWSAVPPDATPEKVRALDLKGLAKKARGLRHSLSGK